MFRYEIRRTAVFNFNFDVIDYSSVKEFCCCVIEDCEDGWTVIPLSRLKDKLAVENLTDPLLKELFCYQVTSLSYI